MIPPNPTSRHFGWPWREGMHGTSGRPAARETVVGSGNAGNCVEPCVLLRAQPGQPATVDGNCQSITGGLIVDSCQWPDAFRGRFYFGDGAANNFRIWSVQPTPNRDGVTAGSRQDFARATGQVVHFGVGPDGALYWVSHDGHITRAAPRTPLQCTTPDGGPGTGGAGGAAGTGGSSGAATGGAAGARRSR